MLPSSSTHNVYTLPGSLYSRQSNPAGQTYARSDPHLSLSKMSLFGSLPPEARVRRPVTEEEATDAELAAELADLPDDEGMLEELEPPVIEEPQLKRRRRDASEDAQMPLQMHQQSDMQDGKNKAVPTSASQTTAGALPETYEPAEEKPHTVQDNQPAQPPNPADDQVAAALRKITSHISNPTKFPKASPLLRQLLESGTIDKQHRTFVFDAIRAVFSLQPGRHKHLVDPMNRREVLKLTTAAESLAASGYFIKSEKAQITEVYHLLGITCNEMQTDDSFMFSKVLTKLRAAVDQLPEASDETDKQAEAEAYAHVTSDKPGSSHPVLSTQPVPTHTHTQHQASYQQQQDETTVDVQHTTQAESAKQEQQAAPRDKVKKSEPAVDDPFGLDAILQPPSTSEASADDDPFGLGALMDLKPRQAARPPPPVKPKPAQPVEPDSTAWGPAELLAARRCAVLICVKHACTFHKHAWAQTGIELLAEHCWKSKAHFSPAQHAELDELWVWVRKARAARKVGPSAKEINRDSTSFERARAEWSKATVSARGKVGAQGDAKAANWLG